MNPAGPPESTAALPLFPLNTVLFPGGPLSLRIFEPRYLDMVRACMRAGVPFGVVAIRAGSEVGAVAEIASLGTTARIVDFDTLPDGLLGISCRGDRRFRVRERWQQDDGLNVGGVDYLSPAPAMPLPAEYRHLGGLLSQVLPQLAVSYPDPPDGLDDADWVANRLAEILPLGLAQKLQLLELDEPVARLARLQALITVVSRDE